MRCRLLAVFSMIGAMIGAPIAFAGSAVEELRNAFMVEGKPIPPEISDDLGGSDLSNSTPILVTVDLRPPIDSIDIPI